MRGLHTKRQVVYVLISALGLATPGFSFAAESPAPSAKPPQAQQGQFIDGIAAVVNKQVITLRQLDSEVKSAAAQLKQQKIQVPDLAILQKQVLQRMITEELVRQEADRLGVRVSDAEVDRAVQVVAERNRISVDTLRKEIARSGGEWKEYRETLRREIRVDKLRQRAVDSQIVITDPEVDAFIKNQERRGGGPMLGGSGAPAREQAAPAPAQTGPAILGLAQILVQVPEGSAPERVQQLRAEAEGLLAKLRGGADFASLAAAASDDQNALKGGEMGVRPVAGWPDLFVQATQNLSEGQISGIVQSGNGFHILKVLTRGPEQPQARTSGPAANSPQTPMAQQGPMMVTQTHARHILIKVTKVKSDEQARTQLQQLRQRIEMGESFEDLAKRYSEDVSAPQGGDLGWLTPGETVPAFEQAMNALQPGQVSQPVHSPFGWHLIEVEERRTKDMEDEYKRMQARQILFQRRAEPAFEDWLNRLHGEAYIDNRLDPQSNRNNRRAR